MIDENKSPAILSGSLATTKEMLRDYPQMVRDSLISLISSMTDEQLAKAERIEIITTIVTE